MFFRKRAPQSSIASPPEPAQDGAVRVFQSAEHLVAWLGSVQGRPAVVRAVTPRHLGDLSVALARLATEPRGGVLLVLGPQGPKQTGWLDDARQEHGADAITGPWPVRVQGEAGLLVGVSPSEPPRTWEDIEPDAWPVPDAADSPLDPHRVQALLRAQPFARPVGTSEADHEAEALVHAGVRRWFRGRLVPTIAGLVAFGQAPDRYLPGAAVAIRWPGRSEQLHQGALPWLVRRISEERALWGAVPTEVAARVVVLALAERAWAGPDARTPITVSVEPSGLRLAIPTRAANRQEQEDRAPGNPRLRQLLVRLGLLPAGTGGDIPDNDEVLAEIGRRFSGIQHRFDDDATWIEVPWRQAGTVEPMRGMAVVIPVARPHAVGGAAPALDDQPAVAAEIGARSAEAVVVETSATASPRSTASASRRTRPASARSAPVFHPRPPVTPAVASAAPPTAPPSQATSAPEPRPPSLEPAPSRSLPAVTSSDATPVTTPWITPPQPDLRPASQAPPAATIEPPPEILVSLSPTASPGPRSKDERKAQLRALFLASDRPLGLRELAEALGVHRDTLNPALKALIAEGWLEPTDPTPRSPVQRYRRVGG